MRKLISIKVPPELNLPRAWPGAPATGTARTKTMMRAVPEAGAPFKPRQCDEV
jgi:hypothetical protein